jgi:hypothetical protein
MRLAIKDARYVQMVAAHLARNSCTDGAWVTKGMSNSFDDSTAPGVFSPAILARPMDLSASAAISAALSERALVSAKAAKR